MLVEADLPPEIQQASVAGMSRTVSTSSIRRYLKAPFAHERLEACDETPMPLVQQQEDSLLNLERILRLSGHNLHALRDPIDGRLVPEVYVDTQARVQKLHLLQVLESAASIQR